MCVDGQLVKQVYVSENEVDACMHIDRFGVERACRGSKDETWKGIDCELFLPGGSESPTCRKAFDRFHLPSGDTFVPDREGVPNFCVCGDSFSRCCFRVVLAVP